MEGGRGGRREGEGRRDGEKEGENENKGGKGAKQTEREAFRLSILLKKYTATAAKAAAVEPWAASSCRCGRRPW